MKAELERKYELTEAHRLGPAEEDDKEARVLNRIVRWTKDGLEYEADPRHVEILVKDLKLEDAKSVVTPGTKEEGHLKEGCEVPLSSDWTSHYRASVARLNYLAADRPDVAFSVKELARTMSAPTSGCWEKLKRLARYLVGRPRAAAWECGGFQFRRFFAVVLRPSPWL